MVNGNYVVVVSPAFKAARTLRQTLASVPHDIVDQFVLVDDCSPDDTVAVAAVAFGFEIGEISCPTRYFPEASSINFSRSVQYGFGVLATAIAYRLHCWG